MAFSACLSRADFRRAASAATAAAATTAATGGAAVSAATAVDGTGAGTAGAAAAAAAAAATDVAGEINGDDDDLHNIMVKTYIILLFNDRNQIMSFCSTNLTSCQQAGNRHLIIGSIQLVYV